MATADVGVTTTSDVNKIWRKVQTTLEKGLNFEVEEYDHLESIKKFKVNMSTREILVPLDIQEGYGAGALPEDGYEMRPSSPNARELSLSWTIFNKRFTITKQARWVDQYSRAAMIENQFKFQGMKAIQALAAHVGDYMWGASTARLAQVDDGGGALGAATSHTITLKNGFTQTSITDAGYLARLFRVGDYVALESGGSLVTNAIGVITDRDPVNGTIDVDWNGSVDPSDDDYIVKANSLENTTIAGTDYNLGLIGFTEMVTATSVHGLSSSTEANWDVAFEDTAGGRLTGIRLMKAKQEIQNWGGGKLTDMWIAQGVERDMIALHQAAVRFGSPMGMETDGSIKSKGVSFHSSRRTPPGWALGYDKASVRKLTLLPSKPGQPKWEDGEKLENRPVWAFGIDLPMQLVVLNRKNTVYFNGLTEQ